MAGSTPEERARELRRRAAEDVEGVDPAAVLELLRYPDRAVQGEAARALLALVAEYPHVGEGAVAALADLLSGSDVDHDSREVALRCLAHIAADTPERVADVRESVSACITPDDEGGLNAAATVCLVQLAAYDPGPFHAEVERYGRLLESEDDAVQRHAAYVLRQVATATPGAVAPLVDTLVGRTAEAGPEARVTLLSAVGVVAVAQPAAVESVVPDVTALAGDDDAEVRSNVAALLGELADDAPHIVGRERAALVALLDDDDAVVRRNASTAALRVAARTPDAVDDAGRHLLELVDDPDAEVRHNACVALGHLEETLALELLRSAATDDPDAAVREAARWAIERIR